MNQVFFLSARILQISKTAREKNVKQLSMGSYGPSTIGKGIRVITSLKERAYAFLGAHTLGKIPFFSHYLFVFNSRLYYEFGYCFSNSLLSTPFEIYQP